MSGGGGGSKTQTVTQSNAPWSQQIPLWMTSYQRLNDLYKSGGLRINPYPGQTVAPVSPETSQAWSMTANRAQAGSPLNNLSKGYIGDVLSGKYLGQDAPGFASVLDRARNAVNATYARGGRYGSGAHDTAVAQGLGGILNDAYQAERGRMDAAAQAAPQLAQQDYFDAQQLAKVGRQREANLQDLINAEIQRYNALQQAPINELALYQNFIGGNIGSTQTATQPAQNRSPNPWQVGTGIIGSLLGQVLG
ncbi:MAG: hypothetical protein ACREEP_14825 [Dongiaceae bacterium]